MNVNFQAMMRKLAEIHADLFCQVGMLAGENEDLRSQIKVLEAENAKLKEAKAENVVNIDRS